MTSNGRVPVGGVRRCALLGTVVLFASCGSGADDARPVLTVPAVELVDAAAPAPSTTVDVSSTTTTSTSAPEPDSTADVRERSLQCTATLPLEVRIGQVLMPFVYGDSLDAALGALTEWELGGVILMRWPEGASPEALLALVEAAEIPLHVAVDEEGGVVQRLRGLGDLPSAREAAGAMTSAEAEQMIADHAARVAELGVTMVFAPVVDVTPTSGPDTMGSRAFGSDPDIVSDYAAAYGRGWRSAGILPVLKHFPGHGSAAADTHESAAQTPPLDDLWMRDLLPYTRLSSGGEFGVMVGHLDVPGLTDADGVPASLSPAAITGLLRGELGFSDALVVTDALNMQAITDRFTTEEAALAALVAGSDVLLYASLTDTASIVSRLTAALETGELGDGQLTAAAHRVLRSKGLDPCDIITSVTG